MSYHGLIPRQVDLIRGLLNPYAGRIEQVGLFGSRANGRYKPNSDIDLVLYGPVDQKLVNQLHTAFLESYLPFRVDIVAYDLITHPPLKAHIDAVAQVLFTREDLRLSP